MGSWLRWLSVAFLLSGCGPKYPNCSTDDHCTEQGEVCVNKTCRPCRDDSQCMKDNPCGACMDYTCGRVEGCCTSDLDCPDGACYRPQGQEVGTCGAQCGLVGGVEKKCKPGFTCVNGRCQQGDDCGGCPPGQSCVNGQCVAGGPGICQLEVVLFDFNASRIRGDAATVLKRNAQCIKKKKIKRVRITGHTDERGTEEYNMALGERRANSVRDYLKNLGVKAKLNAISYGEEQPTCNGSGESCWSKNRRAELKEN